MPDWRQFFKGLQGAVGGLAEMQRNRLYSNFERELFDMASMPDMTRESYHKKSRDLVKRYPRWMGVEKTVFSLGQRFPSGRDMMDARAKEEAERKRNEKADFTWSNKLGVQYAKDKKAGIKQLLSDEPDKSKHPRIKKMKVKQVLADFSNNIGSLFDRHQLQRTPKNETSAMQGVNTTLKSIFGDTDLASLYAENDRKLKKLMAKQALKAKQDVAGIKLETRLNTTGTKLTESLVNLQGVLERNPTKGHEDVSKKLKKDFVGSTARVMSDVAQWQGAKKLYLNNVEGEEFNLEKHFTELHKIVKAVMPYMKLRAEGELAETLDRRKGILGDGYALQDKSLFDRAKSISGFDIAKEKKLKLIIGELFSKWSDKRLKEMIFDKVLELW